MRSIGIRVLAVFIRLGTTALAVDGPWPATSWTAAEPSTLGWSTEKLKEAEDYAWSYAPTAVMIVQGGQSIARWGMYRTR